MNYLKLYESFNKKKKSYFFGKRDGSQYKGDYIYLTEDLGYAGSFASSNPKTVYEFTLNFDEKLIFSLNNPNHKKN